MPTYQKGCLWEEYPWRIDQDAVVRYCGETACHHCRKLSPDDPKWENWRNPGALSEEEGPQWLCPWVVIAFNEGNYNSTGVCLLCILEAAKTLGIEGER